MMQEDSKKEIEQGAFLQGLERLIASNTENMKSFNLTILRIAAMSVLCALFLISFTKDCIYHVPAFLSLHDLCPEEKIKHIMHV